MTAIEQVGFHESTVVELSSGKGVLTLELDDVFVDGRKARAIFTVSSVVGVTVDGVPSTASFKENGDGEVLSLDLSEEAVSLIIEWNDFSRSMSSIKSYMIFGGTASISFIE